jgi:hypothetical protein
MKTDVHFLLHIPEFYLEREMFQIKFVEKIKTRILYYIYSLYDIDL